MIPITFKSADRARSLGPNLSMTPVKFTWFMIKLNPTLGQVKLSRFRLTVTLQTGEVQLPLKICNPLPVAFGDQYLKDWEAHLEPAVCSVGTMGTEGSQLDSQLVYASTRRNRIMKLKEPLPPAKTGVNQEWSVKTLPGKSMKLKLKMTNPIVNVQMELQCGIITQPQENDKQITAELKVLTTLATTTNATMIVE